LELSSFYKINRVVAHEGIRPFKIICLYDKHHALAASPAYLLFLLREGAAASIRLQPQARRGLSNVHSLEGLHARLASAEIAGFL
jgi:hypothetical protein